MKRALLAMVGLGCGLLTATDALAGGLFLPGAGAVSTSRAGAAVASADDGEALVLNPAGLAKTKGTTITLSAAIIKYVMKFSRRGDYDYSEATPAAYQGQRYPTVENDPSPAGAIGGYQPVPILVVTSDLGGAVPNLRVAAGIYAPNAYPFRDLCSKINGTCRHFNFAQDAGNTSLAPLPARYDVVTQDALVLAPSVAASYRIIPQLDVGARFGLGFAHFKSRVAVWGAPGNVTEDVGNDALLTVDVSDGWIPVYGIGATYRPTPSIELGVNYSSQLDINAKGTNHADFGPTAAAGQGGLAVSVQALHGADAQCADTGTDDKQAACVSLQVPKNAQLGGRYKFLDAKGNERGDVELDLNWENWGAKRASDYLVHIDAVIAVNGTPQFNLKDNLVPHGFQDTYGVRLGGSWRFPLGSDVLIARAGVAYDTATAKDGWLRADIDGAARTTATVGAGYHTDRFEVNIGGGVVLEGTNDNSGVCNPISSQPADRGCARDGNERPVDQRQGPDPINPIVTPDQQREAPVNRGVFSSHYVMFMLGAKTWF
ncbi:MAG TPA: outer membrane protein transport protein [Kofleriaceae bacterium]|jgi:long-subunit fatty acid transport protein